MQQSDDVKNAALRFYEAVSKGDAAAIERLVSREAGVLNVGTDPDEWWAGHEAISRAFRVQMEEMGGGMPVETGDIQAYAEGSVGWVADQPKFKLPDGTELPFRLTAIFHKEDGDWKMVLNHVSIGVKNEEAVGQELTI